MSFNFITRSRMFSFFKRKYFLNLLFYFSIISLLLLGCKGLRVGDSYKDLEEKDSKGGLACVKDLKNNFKNYFNERLENQEVEDMFSCIIMVLINFKNNVSGEESKKYSKQELKIFLQKVFNRNISDESIEEVMGIKFALFRGNKNEVTKEEINQLMKFINKVKVIFVQFNSFNKVFFEDNLQSQKQFDETIVIMKSVLIQFIGSVFLEPYSISSFERLVQHIYVLLEGKSAEYFVKKYKKYFKFFESWKVFILSNSSKDAPVKPDQWKWLLKSTVDVFSAYAYMKWSLNNDTLLRGRIYFFKKAFENWFLFLKNTQSEHVNIISTDSLNQLMESLYETSLISNKIKRSEYQYIVRFLFGKIKWEMNAGGKFFDKSEDFKEIEREFNSWKSIQYFVEKNSSSTSKKDILEKFSKELYEENIQKDFQEILKFGNFYRSNTKNIAKYFDKESLSNDAFNDVNTMVYSIYYFLIKIIYKRYLVDLNGWKFEEFKEFYKHISVIHNILRENSLSQEELNTKVNDSIFAKKEFVLLQSLKLIYTSNYEDKDSVLSLRELTEGISFIQSILKMSQDFQEHMGDTCLSSDQQCVKENLLNLIKQRAFNMPFFKENFQFNNYKEIISDSFNDKRNRYIETLFKIGFDGEKIDFQKISSILHLQEMIFVKFDKNGDGVLDNEEGDGEFDSTYHYFNLIVTKLYKSEQKYLIFDFLTPSFFKNFKIKKIFDCFHNHKVITRFSFLQGYWNIQQIDSQCL